MGGAPLNKATLSLRKLADIEQILCASPPGSFLEFNIKGIYREMVNLEDPLEYIRGLLDSGISPFCRMDLTVLSAIGWLPVGSGVKDDSRMAIDLTPSNHQLLGPSLNVKHRGSWAMSRD
jgi:hypothetical protein